MKYSLIERLFGDAPSYSELVAKVEELDVKRVVHDAEKGHQRRVDREVAVERGKFIEALKFYADKATWRPRGLKADASPGDPPAVSDRGRKARAALGIRD